MTEQDINLKLKLIKNELKRHLKILVDDPIQNSATLIAMENVGKIMYMTDRVIDRKIPENEIESSIEFLEEYIKKINQK